MSLPQSSVASSLKRLTALKLSNNADLRAALDKLTDASATIEANDPVLAFSKRLTRLDALVSVNTFPFSNASVSADFPELFTIAGKVKANDPIGYFTTSGNALVAAVTPNKAVVKTTRSEVRMTTTTLLPLLEEIDEADPVAAIAGRAGSTGGMVDRLVTATLKNEPSVRQALESDCRSCRANSEETQTLICLQPER